MKTYYGQPINTFETMQASELPVAIGEMYPDIRDEWMTMRQIGFRGESAKHSVMSILRDAVCDSDGEVWAIGAYYIAFTTHSFSESIANREHFFRASVTSSPCIIANGVSK